MKTKKLVMLLMATAMCFAFTGCDLFMENNSSESESNVQSSVEGDGSSGSSSGDSDSSEDPVEVKFTVTFDSVEGTAVAAQEVVDGQCATAPANPFKEGHTFAGWLCDGAPFSFDTPITENITLTANWTINKYTVTWVDEDGTVLETDVDVEYGAIPTFDGVTPSKAANAQYTYTFKDWGTIVPVVGDITYTATYTSTLNKYTVTWVDEDGTELETDVDVEYGTTPIFDGETPSKASTVEYIYTFAGWGTIVPVEGDVTYTASYTSSAAPYTVTWVDEDGNELDIEIYTYGQSFELLEVEEGYYYTYFEKVGDTYSETEYDMTADGAKVVTENKVFMVVKNQMSYSVLYQVGDSIVKEVNGIPATIGATATNDQVVVDGANVYVFPKSTETIDDVADTITVVGESIANVDFAAKEGVYDFLTAANDTSSNTAGTYEGKEGISITGMSLWNKELVNAAREAGYWTMTMSIFVPATVEGTPGFKVHGYMEGNNTHNALPLGPWYCQDLNASSVIIEDADKGKWHTLYLDLTRFYDDENLFFYFDADNSEMYISEVKFNWVQQDLSSGKLDLSVNPELKIIPTFTACVKNPGGDFGLHLATYVASGDYVEWNGYTAGESLFNGFSLLRGYLVKAKADGFNNIDFKLTYGGFPGTVGQYYAYHADGQITSFAQGQPATELSYDLGKLLDLKNPVTDGDLGCVDLNANSRNDVRLTFQGNLYLGGCPAVIYYINFSK